MNNNHIIVKKLKNYLFLKIYDYPCSEIIKFIKNFFINYFTEIYIREKYRRILKETNKIPYSNFNNPIIGNIEINQNCNLNCIMCNRGDNIGSKRLMDLILFEKVIRSGIKHGQKCFLLWQLNEPLLIPNLEDYFKVLLKYHVQARITSNALLLDKRIDLLCQYSDVLKEIIFSIDGATKETYELIRRPGKFEKLISNLELIKKINEESKLFHTITISSIVSKDVQHELAYHLKYYSKFVPMKNIKLHLVSGPPNNNQYFFEKTIFPNHIQHWSPCFSLNQIHILIDGKVSACCGELSGDLIYGSIEENTISELFVNDTINRLREYHTNKTLPSNISCSSCYHTNSIITSLWECLYQSMAIKYEKNWDISQMQNKFNNFFNLCQDQIPTEDEYLLLFN